MGSLYLKKFTFLIIHFLMLLSTMSRYIRPIHEMIINIAKVKYNMINISDWLIMDEWVVERNLNRFIFCVCCSFLCTWTENISTIPLAICVTNMILIHGKKTFLYHTTSSTTRIIWSINFNNFFEQNIHIWVNINNIKILVRNEKENNIVLHVNTYIWVFIFCVK